jgi:hypothetical protein
VITYGRLGAIYPNKYYYVASNDKKEPICYMLAEEKKKYEQLIEKVDFDLRLGKEFM